MGIAGRIYLDPGDKQAGYYNPPRLCVAICGWGQGGGPRNAWVRYEDGSEAVVPFSRRLRRAGGQR